MDFILTRDKTFGWQLSAKGSYGWLPPVWCGTRQIAVAVLASLRG